MPPPSPAQRLLDLTVVGRFTLVVWRLVGRLFEWYPLMRASLRSIANQVVILLMVTFMSMSMAMAAYICPQTPTPVPVAMEMPEGVPCAEMDREQPTLCQQSQAGDDLVLDLPSTLSVTEPERGFVLPAPPLAIPSVISHIAFDAPAASRSSPYLNTRRLRI